MNNKKLFALSVAALLGFGTVGSLGIRAFSKPAVVAGNQVLHETTKADTIGEAIAFGNHIKRAGEADSVNSVIGVQTFAGATEGTTSLRFVAALTGYQGLAGAKWSRAAIVNGETTVKEASEFEVNAVYTSLADAETVKWSTAPTADYTYYMVYTLANIPAAFDYSVINVTFNVTDLAGTVSTPVTQAANVAGVKGDGSLNVKTVAATGDKAGQYYASAKSTSYKEYVVPAYATKTTGYVAEQLGPVTALDESAAGAGSNGAFENASSMNSISLPATITKFDTWCFSNSKLQSIEFPRDLVEIGSYSFNSVSTIKTIYWNAKNLTTVTTPRLASKPEIYISSEVESLPSNSIFLDGNAPTKIVYGGTEAQWAALMEGKTGNGLNIDYVICSDTTIATYTYHLNGGTYNGNEGDYVAQAIVGKAVGKVKPSKTGKIFAGWYTAAEGGELVDCEAAASGDVEVYAHWDDLPAGVSKENPHILTENETFSVDFMEGMATCYFSFTATETGHYYLETTGTTIDTENSVGTTYPSPKYHAWDSTGAEVSLSTYGRTNDNTYWYYSTSTTGLLSIQAVAGETYTFSHTLYESTFYVDNHVYGTSNYKFYKSTDNDSRATATELDLSEGINVTHVLPDNGAGVCNYYKFVATETKDVYLKSQHNGSTWGGVYMFEEDADGTLKADNSHQKAYVYGTSTESASGATVHIEEGKTYWIVMTWNSNNTNHDDTKSVGFTIGEPPAGTTLGNPVTGVLAANGEAVSIPGSIGGGPLNYYSITLDHEGNYKFAYTKNASYYEGIVTIYDAAGEVVATGKSSAGSYGSYGNSHEILSTLPAGTYTVAVGFTGTTWPSSSPVTLTVSEVLPGSEFGNALDLAFTDGAASVTTTLGKTFYKFTAEAGAKLLSATGDATKIELYSSSKTLLKTWNAGDEEGAYYVYDAGDYYVAITGAGTSALSLTETEVRPDGKSRASAYTIVRDEDHKMDLTQFMTSSTQSTVYFKYEITTPGIYRVWEDTIQSGSAQDGYLRGIYKDDLAGNISFRKTEGVGAFTETYLDDDSGRNPTYCSHRFDFYAEFEVTEPGTYYFGIQLKAASSTITSCKIGIENTDPAAESGETPVTPTPEEPTDDAPECVGTWDLDGDGTITFNENGTGEITYLDETAHFTYSVDEDGFISISNCGVWDQDTNCGGVNPDGTLYLDMPSTENEYYLFIDGATRAGAVAEPYEGYFASEDGDILILMGGQGMLRQHTGGEFSFQYMYNEATKTAGCSPWGALDSASFTFDEEAGTITLVTEDEFGTYTTVFSPIQD